MNFDIIPRQDPNTREDSWDVRMNNGDFYTALSREKVFELISSEVDAMVTKLYPRPYIVED